MNLPIEYARCPIGAHDETRKPCCDDCLRRETQPNYLHKWTMGEPKHIDGAWQCELRITPWK